MLLTNASTDEYFLYKKVKVKKKYSNQELILLQYFNKKINNVFPENVIITENFIFFFVKNQDYFKAKLYLNSFRRNLESKILIIRAEKVLIKLLFGFFPDPYIHDLKLVNEQNGSKTIIVYFLSFKDRGIAIGRKGKYIKAINEIFEKFVILEDVETPIKIKCENIYL